MNRVLVLLADLACLLAFALGGRESHEAGASGTVVLEIVWPFALAAVLAHVALAVRDLPTQSIWPAGVVVVVATYLVGMALRVLSGRGIAPGFLVVAALFLAITMLGWRLVLRLVVARRSGRARPPAAAG